jgi:hypothetical protein
MGVLDFVRAAIQPAAAARVGWLQGEHAADEENKKDALLAATQRRQGILDQLKANVDNSTIAKNNAQAKKSAQGDQVVVPVMGDDGTTTYATRPQAVGKRAPTTNKDIQIRQRIQELTDTGMSAEDANNQARNEFGAAPPSQFSFGTGEDDQGNPVIVRRSTKTGTVTPTGVKAVPPGGQGGARTKAQVATAQNLVASSDKIMTAFEDQMLGGQRNISAHASALARIALSGAGWQSSVAEAALNELDPELAGYIRASKQVSTAERMISPRGGSNYMTQAEAMLSAAGPHANKPLILQAREYRHGLVSGLQTGNGTKAAPAADAPDQDATPADATTPQPSQQGGGASIASHYGIEPVRASKSTAAPSSTSSSTKPTLSAQAQKAMQTEFDEASRNLQSVINSPNASDADKAMARQLYDRAQQHIAKKYRAGSQQ